MLCLFPSTQSINNIYNDLKENLLKRIDTAERYTHNSLAAWLIHSITHFTRRTTCNVVCVDKYTNTSHNAQIAHWQWAHTYHGMYIITDLTAHARAHSLLLLLLENTAKIPHAYVLFYLFPWKTSCLITLDERNMHNNIRYNTIRFSLWKFSFKVKVLCLAAATTSVVVVMLLIVAAEWIDSLV